MLKNNLRRIMFDRSIKSTELEERSGVSRQTISKIRNNPRTIIGTDIVEKLCRALEITPGELLVWEVEQETPVAA